jgi:tripartite-type tricarboxylate transporter receptor subunit TctC
MMKRTRRTAVKHIAAAIAVLATAAALPAGAQEAWPTKPVRFVVPFAPGGSTDVVARLLGQKLSARWGQSVIVENRAGAGGNVGGDLVAKSTPDGYTLLFASGAIAINPHIYKRMPFDADKDLVPITNVASGPMLIVVPDRSPVKNLRGLVALAKSKPGAMNFGSAGVGSQVHMAAENFANAARVEITHVPYKGESPALNDLVAGQLDMMVGNFAAASALVGPGRLRALAVTGKTRAPQLPDVPTASESGLPGFENTGWFGLFAPAGTPKNVLAKIEKDVTEALEETDIKARLYVQGMKPVGNSSEEFAAALRDENKRWSTVVRERNITTN